jgi:hypothetical protein
MLSFLFKVNTEIEDKIHEFDMGHMTISCGENQITSEGHVPNQEMMIFLSVQMLMTSVQKIVEAAKCKSSTFGAVDSSFSIVFKRYKNGEIGLVHKNELICKVASLELVSTLWRASNEFYEKYANTLVGSGAVIGDWEITRSEFKKCLGSK